MLTLSPGWPGLIEQRVIVAHPVDGPRPQPGHQAQDAVLPLDAGRPAELVVVEGDAGEGREEILAHPRPDDPLDEHAHLLVVVEQAALGPVLDGVGIEDRGVDLGHGVGQGGQALLLGPGVGQEEAAVLARRRPSRGCPRAGWRSGR